ncbi:hypothetical protein PC9H_007092 [Pleurotus ostreatus]|uniref:Phospholipid/glycerol acyltransferase domain-containing protein n=1 Tax=Pleurotus ostreatus TaxID=5322 RepID=A0A8H7DPV5_PLEOS|nr:uncharacterized protein PC9H_007092 [Pleurotus ostreatus]KAF7427876.1 hypothetical protein PC9H_007092 [Pleurotus ostreatus]
MSDPPKVLHRVIRRLASWAVWSFFTEVHVIGGENVPKHGPIIVAATHHNMMLDPAILSVAFPYARILNYWSKASLFGNPMLAYILSSSGNIPVDRKSKDRQILFKGTFDALSRGWAVALFPEGTSYTEPRIMQVKDGAAWAALEYEKWVGENPGKSTEGSVTIIPAAIVYTNKSKYRSKVILEYGFSPSDIVHTLIHDDNRFGQPITMDEYRQQFFSSEDGAPRAAAKRLTRTIERELIEATINAPDWDTLYAARMARDIMWEGDKSIDLNDFVAVSQTLVDLFSTPNATPKMASMKRTLLEYYSLLQSTHLTNSVLSSLPLPRTLDPRHPATLPSRFYTLAVLFRDTLWSLLSLPFFVFPLIVHSPVYIMGRLGARLVEDEEETQAQNKVLFGLLFTLLMYPASFFFLWALFMYTPIGAILAFGTVYYLAVYHNKMINDYYENAKRVIAAWRVLVGVWAPRRWEFSTAVLSQYTTPIVPKENPWIDKPKSSTSSPARNVAAPLPSSLASGLEPPEPPVSSAPRRRPPSRRIMRHVLRARVEAVKALAIFFDQLEKNNQRVLASVHLAKLYGGTVEERAGSLDVTSDGVTPASEPVGWRRASEVISFLTKRSAKVPSLSYRGDADWAALSSEGEGEDSEKEKDQATWVPSSS